MQIISLRIWVSIKQITNKVFLYKNQRLNILFDLEKEKIKSRITQNFAKLTDEIRIDEFILSINPEENVTLESNIRVLISELVEYLFDSNLEKKVELFEPRQIIKIKAKKKQYNTSIITNEKDKGKAKILKKNVTINFFQDFNFSTFFIMLNYQFY